MCSRSPCGDKRGCAWIKKTQGNLSKQIVRRISCGEQHPYVIEVTTPNWKGCEQPSHGTKKFPDEPELPDELKQILAVLDQAKVKTPTRQFTDEGTTEFMFESLADVEAALSELSAAGWMVSETLWYHYTAAVRDMEKIEENHMIFLGDKKVSWFTLNKKYLAGSEGDQYRIGVPFQSKIFRSYEDLKLLGEVDPPDPIKDANPDQWFGTSLPVSRDVWFVKERLTHKGWMSIDEGEERKLRKADSLRHAQKTLETKKEAP